MCLGSIELLTEVWQEDGAKLARTQAGALVSLAFTPEAEVGSYVLLYADCAVELLDPHAAADALELRAAAEQAAAGSTSS
jgi:hydrogenase maturation factor